MFKYKLKKHILFKIIYTTNIQLKVIKNQHVTKHVIKNHTFAPKVKKIDYLLFKKYLIRIRFWFNKIILF